MYIEAKNNIAETNDGILFPVIKMASTKENNTTYLISLLLKKPGSFLNANNTDWLINKIYAVVPVCGENPENPNSWKIDDSINSDAVPIKRGYT